MNQESPSPFPANNDLWLLSSVNKLAQVMQDFSDADLDQPWAWGPHAEGVRFALLGTYQELRQLAVQLAEERSLTQPVMAAQHALAQYHVAYRDLQAILLGLDDDHYNQEPAPGEWSVRTIMGHIVRAERTFFALVHYGLRRQRESGDLPERLPDGEVDRLLGPLDNLHNIVNNQGLHEIQAYYKGLHGRVLQECATMSEQELAGPSLWWEEIRYPLQHRLHRFDAHLRQHTIQVEKTLAMLGHESTETKRLLRLVYSALAEIEGFLIGAPELAVEERQKVARKLQKRGAEIANLVIQTQRLHTAITEGDRHTAEEILTAYPTLANAHDQQRLPLILTAAYHRQPEMAALFVEKGADLSIFEAAAIGRLDIVEREARAYPEDITAYGRDGFSALQLACYFGHEAIVRWLVEHGAVVTAVSQNEMGLQAIHAAAASDSFAITRVLLEHGADANARQADGFTPMQTAVHNGNIALIRLLTDFGAENS